MSKITPPRLPKLLKENKSLLEMLQGTNDEIMEYSFRQERLEDILKAGISISSSELVNCSFINGRLKKAHFTDVLFLNCDLSNLQLSGAALTRVEFRGCKLTGTNLADASLYQVLFTDCRSEYLNLSGSKQREVHYQNCLLRGAAMDDCSFTHVSFQTCNLVEAECYQTSLKGIDFTDSDIAGLRVNLIPGGEWKGATVTSLQAVELARLMGVIIRD